MGKKVFLVVTSILIIVAGIITFAIINNNIKEQERIAEIKEGWHIEIVNDFINVRQDADRFSTKIDQVNKGEVYEVIEINLDDYNYYWYKTEKGWVANPKDGSYLNDNNNPHDIEYPTLKYFEQEYKVKSIEEINYNHLEVSDDKDDYTITHVILHEVDTNQNIDQYWIRYTVTDGSGKSITKTQRVIFEIMPNENQVDKF